MLTTTPLTAERMRWYCRNLTADDAAEVAASGHGAEFENAMVDSVAQCAWAKELLSNGLPVAAYGVGVVKGLGVPWLLCCNGIYGVPKRAFFQLAIDEVAQMRKQFDKLINVVDIEHRTAPRFIQALGFQMGLKLAGNHRMQWFYWEKPNV